MGHSFTEDDKKKFIEFLNIVAKNAKFHLDTQQIIEYFKLLQHMQGVILPKINEHILEVVKIVESEQKPEKAKKVK